MTHETLPSLSSMINFAILAGVLGVALRKPMIEGLKARRDYWKTEVDEAEKLRAETEALLRDTEAKVANVNREIQAIHDEAKKAAEAERTALIAQAQAQAQKIVEEAKRMAEAEKAYALKALKRDMLREAIARAKKDLIGKVGPDDHAAFVDSLVDGAGEKVHG